MRKLRREIISNWLGQCLNEGLICKMLGYTAQQDGMVFILLWVFALSESLLIELHLGGCVCVAHVCVCLASSSV